MDLSKATCPGCQRPMQLTHVRCADCGVELHGEFEVSALARLDLEEQVFVTAFVRYHGSLKEMSRIFGISYPTVKNRLNNLAAKLDRPFQVRTPEIEVLERLERGEINPEQALELLR